MPLRVNDLIADTVGLSALEFGAYMRLLMQYWRQAGPLRYDKTYLSRLVGCNAREWRTLETQIRHYWRRFEDNGVSYWRNETMDEVLAQVFDKSEKAKKSAEARWERNDMRTHSERICERNASQSQSQIPTHTTYASVLVSSSSIEDSETRDSSDFGLVSFEQPKKQNSVPYKLIVDMYHDMLPDAPRLMKLTSNRKGMIAARWREHPDMSAFEEFFRRVQQSPFLLGKVEPHNGRRPFVATLDWLMKAQNFAKTLEGIYFE